MVMKNAWAIISQNHKFIGLPYLCIMLYDHVPLKTLLNSWEILVIAYVLCFMVQYDISHQSNCHNGLLVNVQSLLMHDINIQSQNSKDVIFSLYAILYFTFKDVIFTLYAPLSFTSN